MLAVAAATMSGCARKSSPIVGGGVAPAGDPSDSIRLMHVCSKRFQILNYQAVPASIAYEVLGSSESGTVALPAKAAGQTFSHTELENRTRGTLRIVYRRIVTQSAATDGTECPVRRAVPAVAPETIPAWAGADSNRLVDPAGVRSAVARNVVQVMFVPGAPQADRQAAVDLVGGAVIGGRRYLDEGGGLYLVQVPGDSTGERVLRAIRLLATLPQVTDAGVYVTGGRAHGVKRRGGSP